MVDKPFVKPKGVRNVRIPAEHMGIGADNFQADGGLSIYIQGLVSLLVVWDRGLVRTRV